MKEAKRKNKENLIGKIIYGFLLFMPLLAMAITCAYAIFNKNANKSYEQTYISDINSLTDFDYGEEYYFKNIDTSITGSIGESTSRVWTYDFTYNGTNYGNVQFWYYGSNNNITVWAKNFDTNTYIFENGQLYQTSFTFKYLRNSFDTNAFNLIKSTLKRVNTRTIDSVFYYSIDKVEQSTLFNWSKDTGMYTTVHGATELLGITNTFIPMLMSYWLLISVIYIVYDIALVGVHMVHNKIHDFENVM